LHNTLKAAFASIQLVEDKMPGKTLEQRPVFKIVPATEADPFDELLDNIADARIRRRKWLIWLTGVE
jgi:hypothetical protein